MKEEEEAGVRRKEEEGEKEDPLHDYLSLSTLQAIENRFNSDFDLSHFLGDEEVIICQGDPQESLGIEVEEKFLTPYGLRRRRLIWGEPIRSYSALQTTHYPSGRTVHSSDTRLCCAGGRLVSNSNPRGGGVLCAPQSCPYGSGRQELWPTRSARS